MLLDLFAYIKEIVTEKEEKKLKQAELLKSIEKGYGSKVRHMVCFDRVLSWS